GKPVAVRTTCDTCRAPDPDAPPLNPRAPPGGHGFVSATRPASAERLLLAKETRMVPQQSDGEELPGIGLDDVLPHAGRTSGRDAASIDLVPGTGAALDARVAAAGITRERLLDAALALLDARLTGNTCVGI